MHAAAIGLVELAQKPSLAEFFRDPSLSVACVLLIVVSVGWIVVTRLIVHQMKRAARRGLKTPTLDSMRSPRDIWEMPP